MTRDLPEGQGGTGAPSRPYGTENGAHRENGTQPLDRLPPPAFPAGDGARGRGPGASTDGRAPTEGDHEIPDEISVSPDDEPDGSEGETVPDEAFISPDDPLVPLLRDETGKVRATGVADDGKPPSARSRLRDGPTVLELPYLLDQLAEQLHESGESALAVHADTGHFQAALRSFLKGYLQGSRG